MIFGDTSAWFARSVASDPNSARALEWLTANEEPLITTDYVIDETLTLLRARRELRKSIEVGVSFFTEEIATVHYVTPDEIAAAWKVFRDFADKQWSFTDCTSKVVMER